MSDKDREAFEAFVLRGTLPGENFLERDHTGSYMLAVARGGWAAWQAARDHYTPKLTESETIAVLVNAPTARIITEERRKADLGGDGSDMVVTKQVVKYAVTDESRVAALRAAGVRFKDSKVEK